MATQITLKRNLSLMLLLLYGLGTTVGAGIYALIGKIAGVAGYLAPFSFLVAALMAAFTALTFAELSRRLPRAAGEAIYVREGFRSAHLATITGLLVTAAGLVSAAAMVNGFIGYLHEFVQVERAIAIVSVTLLLGFVAAWGIGESVLIASLITIVELGGLLLVIVVSLTGGADFAVSWSKLLPSLDHPHWGGVFAGAILAFYAFIGFEDMVNVAEEVKDVERNMPVAILLTLGIVTLLYVALMVVAVFALPPGELAASEAPLAYLYQHYTGGSATTISLIGLFAIINGALIQVIMAARVLYGLSSMGQLPGVFGRVHPRTRTPLFATAVVTVTVLLLALTGRVTSLAQITSVVMLTVFALVNLALWRIKRRGPRPEAGWVLPVWVPVMGFLVSAGFVLGELARLICR